MHSTKPLILEDGRTHPREMFAEAELELLRRHFAAWGDSGGELKGRWSAEERAMAAELWAEARRYGFWPARGPSGRMTWMRMVNRRGQEHCLCPGSYRDKLPPKPPRPLKPQTVKLMEDWLDGLLRTMRREA